MSVTPAVAAVAPIIAALVPAAPPAPAAVQALMAPPALAAPQIQGDHQPPPLVVKCNGNLKRLGYFLAHIWHYMEWCRAFYPDDVARVDCVGLALDGDVVDWLVALHKDDTNELQYINLTFSCRPYEDSSRTHWQTAEWQATSKLSNRGSGQWWSTSKSSGGWLASWETGPDGSYWTTSKRS